MLIYIMQILWKQLKHALLWAYQELVLVQVLKPTTLPLFSFQVHENNIAFNVYNDKTMAKGEKAQRYKNENMESVSIFS